MSGLSNEDWEKFLNEEEDSSKPEEHTPENTTPFAASDPQDKIDPLVFIDSGEAPELRYQPPKVAYEPSQKQDLDAPYFAKQLDDKGEWVPTSNSEADNSSGIVNNTSGVISHFLRLFLFMIPITVIGITFTVALSIE
jgi:hypothetical protein